MDSRLKYQVHSSASAAEVSNFYYQNYTIDNGIDSGRSVRFHVEGQNECFVDLTECFIKTKFKIVNEDGSKIGPDPQVFPTESYGSNLWSHVNISLNGTPIPSGNEYAYTAQLIEILGSNSETRSNVQGKLNGFYIPSFGSSLIKNARTASYRDEKRLCKNSETIEVYSRIHSDFMMSCSQLLPDDMDITINLTRSRDEFVLGGEERTVKEEKKVGKETKTVNVVVPPPPAKIKVESVSLFVKRICLSPSYRSEISRSISNGGYLQYQRLHAVPFSCNKGQKTWSARNCFNGIAPRKVFVALVTQDAYFGDLKRTCNYFESANISTVRISLNGRDIMAEPYKTNFVYDNDGKIDKTETKALSAFAGLCNTIGNFSSTRQNVGINYDQFINGATIFATNLDHAETDAAVPGSIDVEITFQEGSKEGYMVIVVGEYPKIISFDANRNISFDH